jgi:hypothetical protein
MIGAKTTNEFTVTKNDDGVGDWRPALGSVFVLLEPVDLVELTGIEPVTSCLQSRRSPN